MYIYVLITTRFGYLDISNLPETLIDRLMIEGNVKNRLTNCLVSKEHARDFTEICGLLGNAQLLLANFGDRVDQKYSYIVDELRHHLIELAKIVIGEHASTKDRSIIDHVTKTLRPFRVDPPAHPPKLPKTGGSAKKTLDYLLAELDGLIGLDSVKREVRSLVNLMRVRELRRKSGLPSPEVTLHLVFTATPAQGKRRSLACLPRYVGRSAS
jgi:hypothetical protein